MVIKRLPVRRLPTVAEVLRFDVLDRGDPIVLAGGAGLGTPVRWVHVSEIADIGDLLRGGEMILTTGVALPASSHDLVAYIDALADAHVAALVVGLGPRFQEPLPRRMLDAADRRSLPLVALRRRTAFVDVTEQVHASLVDIQIRELQSSEAIHTIFRDLAVQGASPEQVLRHVARLCGFAVVLENSAHQIIDFALADRESEDVLAEWSQHRRRPPPARRTAYHPRTGWLTTVVGARGHDWGHLVLMTGSVGDRSSGGDEDAINLLPSSLVMLLERAASTLALGRLIDHDQEALDLNTHRSILGALISTSPLERDVVAEAAALDVPLGRHDLLALSIRMTAPAASGDPRSRQAHLRRLSAHVADLLRSQRRAAIVAPVDDESVGVLVPVPRSHEHPHLVRHVVDGLRNSALDAVVACAGPEPGVDNARLLLREARDVAKSAADLGMPQEVVRFEDLGIREIVYGLRDDSRFQRFAATRLAPLIEHDAENGSSLLSMLEVFLASGRNKSTAARTAFVSRVWMHEQLRRAASLLGVDLEDEAACLDLQVALLIHRLPRV